MNSLELSADRRFGLELAHRTAGSGFVADLHGSMVRRWRWPVILLLPAILFVLPGCTTLGLLALNTRASLAPIERQVNLHYAAGGAGSVDVYRPKPTVPGPGLPLVVFFHGGGWDDGDKNQYRFVGAALAETGLVAVLPNYRLYPHARRADFMADAARSLAWARAHAAEWGADPTKVFVMGHSAGAHIALLLALDERYLNNVGGTSRWLRGVIGLSGPYDFLPFTEKYLEEVFGPPAAFPDSQPIRFVRAGAPPAFLAHGLKDRRVRVANTERLAAAMRALGNAVETRYYDAADHAQMIVALSPVAPHRFPVLSDVRAFIEENTR